MGPRTALAGAALAALFLPACITETLDAQGRPIEASSRAGGRMRTRGVIVREPLQATWARVRSIVESMTNEPLRSNGVPKSLVTEVAGAETSVLVERFDAERTIVHVRSADASVEERIRVAVMRDVGR
ncbi:MAG: hypothetical protein AAFP86_13435 [Planctomycetota bacterium]